MLSQDGLRSDSFRRIYLLMSSLKTKSLDTKESLRTLPNTLRLSAGCWQLPRISQLEETAGGGGHEAGGWADC